MAILSGDFYCPNSDSKEDGVALREIRLAKSVEFELQSQGCECYSWSRGSR